MKELNGKGNKRGMSLNSRKNLELGHKPNIRTKKGVSITRIQREMMEQLCPYAKDPTMTWAMALAEAGMRDALTEEKARENLKDRLEGKVTLPISGASGEPLVATFVFQMPDGSRLKAGELGKADGS